MKIKLNKTILAFVVIMLSLIVTISCLNNNKKDVAEDFTGSKSCIECHARFYSLWSTSHHGLAMQPITSKFIQNEILLNQEEIFMENAYYKALVEDSILYINERKDDTNTKYEILWALGGKNVYYFLTAIDGGRLQTLPLAYNLNTKLWYNNPESAIRHFPNMGGDEITDEALSWKDLQYTFNTSCYGCHVSQLENNYDLTTNTYETNWKEAGINCETCHGPAGEHVKAARLAERKGDSLIDIKLIVTSTFTQEQHNASCAPCHAKMSAITPSYLPGDRYFDNYDLITLENNDFYPDGRDLGENYTMTGWHMNKCATEGELHCVMCHTSSGRYRFKSDDLVTANKACTSCHSTQGENYETHTHHPISSVAPQCIECHMPFTTFGHMNRSDHSFRPPMPKATIEFGSPNACNICHDNQTAEWSQKYLVKWKKDNGYQNQTLKVGKLIIEARSENWDNLNEMLNAIKKDTYGEVFTTSLIRLLTNCPDSSKREAMYNALDFSSPLIRSAAASALMGFTDELTKKSLLKAAKDEYLLVRLSTAVSLSIFPTQRFTTSELELFNSVNNEYVNSLTTRPDNWSSHYNLGNHYQNLGETDKAISSYETSHRIYPEGIMPLVNVSFLYSVSGYQNKAEEYLEKALLIDPMNEAANFNYGLLMAELKKFDLAEKSLRNVVTSNKNNASAAYNLSIIVSQKNMDEACEFSRIAMEADTNDPKFAYTHAYFLHANKQTVSATTILKNILAKHTQHSSSVFLLGNIYEEQDKVKDAILIYQKAYDSKPNDQQFSIQLQQNILRLKEKK